MTEQKYCDLFLRYNRSINESIKLEWINRNSQLFAKLVNIDISNGYTALHYASFYGHTKIVKLLLEANASVDTKPKYKSTPLHWAARNRYTEIVKLLLNANASVDTQNINGHTVLHIATRCGHTKIVKLLLEATLYE